MYAQQKLVQQLEDAQKKLDDNGGTLDHWRDNHDKLKLEEIE